MSEVPTKRAKMIKRYLFVFSQTHVVFRAPEVAAICDLLGIPFDRKSLDNQSTHLHILEFPSDEPIKQILSRSTRIRAVYEILEEGRDLDELEARLRAKPELFKPFDGPEDSWRFRVRPQGKKPGNDLFNELRERFTSVMTNTSAPVDLKNPVHEFNLIEDFTTESQDLRRAYLCRTVGEGQLLLKSIYNLKERKYIGNSTMDPELAFIQANLIQARPASLVLDPFCGTVTFLISFTF
uniref:UPF0020 domain-containing protein n=1 Tax=Panagrellus redivivus TaxID=6233 RepID=A0A7E4VN70_PANRE